MRFSTIFTVLAASSMVLASAVPEIFAKRDGGDVPTALNGLGSTLNGITPGFSGCKDDSCTGQVTNKIVDAINNQATTIGSSPCGSDGSAVAQSIAGVINNVVPGLSSHKGDCGSSCPNLSQDYSSVDSSLASCVKKALDPCPAAKPLLPNVLANLKPTLQGLSFTSTISACGL